MGGRARVMLAVWVLGAAGAAWGQVPAEGPVVLASLVRSTEAHVQADSEAILARRDVAEADRKKLTEILQRAHAAADKLAAEAGDKSVDAKITRQEFQPLLDHFVTPVIAEFNSFVTPRPDLDWMAVRAEALVRVEDRMLQGDFMGAVKDAGIGETKAAEIRGILETKSAEERKLSKLAAAAYVVADDAEKLKLVAEMRATEARNKVATRAAVRAKLTPEEVAALEWQLLKEYRNMPTYETLGYSMQAQAWAVPEDGAYALELFPDRKVLGTATLKKGVVMGFKKVDGVLKAVAGEKVFDVPAGGVVYWKRAGE